MNLRRAECEAPLPPGWVILLDWPLTARAICLWRIHGSGNIYEFTPGGARSTFASGLDDPFGLAFNGAGDLFEADYGSGNIYEFTPGGTQSTFASGVGPPCIVLGFFWSCWSGL